MSRRCSAIKSYCRVAFTWNHGVRLFPQTLSSVLRSSWDTVLYAGFLLAALKCEHFPVSLKPFSDSFQQL